MKSTDKNLLPCVSIHAPVMDANLARYPLESDKCFNPRARDGRERNHRLLS